VPSSYSGSVVEGRLEDSWFIGAAAILAPHPAQLLENLFGSDADDFKRWGVFTCRFYVNGAWREIVTDTRVPAVSDSEGEACAIYGRSLEPSECWVSFLEKAYAKLRGSYQALDGGSIIDALVELTGGSGEDVDLATHAKAALAEVEADAPPPLWELLKARLAVDDVLAVSLKSDLRMTSGQRVRADGVRETPLGLLADRAYGVMCVKEVMHMGAEHRFVQLRNPWSRGQGRGDWRGAWSNSSTQWDDCPEVLQEILSDPRISWDRAEGGSFFVDFESFCSRFNTLHVCRLFPDSSFRQYKVANRWAGKTAAGGLDQAEEPRLDDDDKDEKDADVVNKLASAYLKHHCKNVQKDSDAYWFNNPQLRVSTAHLSHAVEVHVSLMQCAPLAAREPLSMAFEILRTKRNADHLRVWSMDACQVVARREASTPATREVSLSGLRLEPGWQYSVVAHTALRGREAEFVLRIFSPTDLHIQPVPETLSLYIPGAWRQAAEHDTAGGPALRLDQRGTLRANPKWCHNPQFVLRFVDGDEVSGKAVDVKLVLRRTDSVPEEAQVRKRSNRRGDEEEAQTLGLVVCKAKLGDAGKRSLYQAKLDAATAPCNALGEPKTPKHSTLRKKATRSDATLGHGFGDGFGDESAWATGGDRAAAVAVAMPPRKMLFDPKEWHVLSSLTQPVVATLLLPGLQRARFPNGIVVAPCLSEAGAAGTFVLEVHSDVSVSVEAVPENRSKTLAGEWRDGTAGGSHLHAASCKGNPKYRLIFSADAAPRAQVNIVLSRPEQEWKTNDMVGSMMGFYLSKAASVLGAGDMTGGPILHEGRPWSESPFVPMHAVATPADFSLETDVPFDIMPATYAPGKHGRFYLSVTSDAEFSLALA